MSDDDVAEAELIARRAQAAETYCAVHGHYWTWGESFSGPRRCAVCGALGDGAVGT